jgi:DNA-binding response OmpR family regulator
MHIFIIDPKYVMARISETAFRANGWRSTVIQDYAAAIGQIMHDVPDAIVVQGDGVSGATAHLCQRFKSNALTAGIPIVHIEEAIPTPWLVTGVPADAVLQMPWDPEELIQQIEMIVPMNAGTDDLDDLTNLPRRRAALGDIAKRLVAQERFAIGRLTLRQIDSYRQNYGRMGLDQFAVVLSSLLRRNDNGFTPASFGYLDEGNFIVVGDFAQVTEIISNVEREFEVLVPSFYDSGGMFGAETSQADGPATWVGVHGAVFEVEPGQYDNLLQMGYALSDVLELGELGLFHRAHQGQDLNSSNLAA